MSINPEINKEIDQSIPSWILEAKNQLISQRIQVIKFSPTSNHIHLPGHEPMQEVDQFFRSKGYDNYISFRLSDIQKRVGSGLTENNKIQVTTEVVHTIGTVDVRDDALSDSDNTFPEGLIKWADLSVRKGSAGNLQIDFAQFKHSLSVETYKIKTKEDLIKELKRIGYKFELPGHKSAQETGTYTMTGYDDYITFDKDALIMEAGPQFYYSHDPVVLEAFVVHTLGDVNMNLYNFYRGDDGGTNYLRRGRFVVSEKRGRQTFSEYGVQFIEFVPFIPTT